jgi:hypothetical protein
MRRSGRTDCYQPGDNISNAFVLNPELFDWLTTGLSKGRNVPEALSFLGMAELDFPIAYCLTPLPIGTVE